MVGLIPALNEHGYLPPGVHRATLDEVIERFGTATLERRELAQSLRWLVEMCHRDDVERLVVNGSFVTAKPNPADIDCVLQGGPTFGQHGISIHEWRSPLPFIQLEIGDATIFDAFVDGVFGTDRNLVAKGVVEVQL